MKFDAFIGANLSGSMGGITASKNKAGGYFKRKPIPTQPNTTAQLRAKVNFGMVSSVFRSLSGVMINSWNNFALSKFSPRNNTNSGQYSGQQSFQALNVGFTNSISSNRTFSVKVNGAVLPGGETFDNFIGASGIAPINASSTALLLTGGGSVPISVISGSVNATGIATFKCQVGSGAGVDLASFSNAFGDAVGFCAFLSSGNPAQNMSFSNPDRYLLGYFNPIIATVQADISAIKDFEITATQSIDLAQFKTFPSTGENVQLSIYVVTKKNQMNLVGRIPLVVS